MYCLKLKMRYLTEKYYKCRFLLVFFGLVNILLCDGNPLESGNTNSMSPASFQNETLQQISAKLTNVADRVRLSRGQLREGVCQFVATAYYPAQWQLEPFTDLLDKSPLWKMTDEQIKRLCKTPNCFRPLSNDKDFSLFENFLLDSYKYTNHDKRCTSPCRKSSNAIVTSSKIFSKGEKGQIKRPQFKEICKNNSTVAVSPSCPSSKHLLPASLLPRLYEDKRRRLSDYISAAKSSKRRLSRHFTKLIRKFSEGNIWKKMGTYYNQTASSSQNNNCY